jgi:hypothetical protein
MHSFESGGPSTVPATDLDVISYLSCALMCQAFANFYASKANHNLPEIEAIGYGTRVTEFTDLAKKFMDLYESEITDDNTGYYGNVEFSKDLYFDRDAE